VLGNNSSCAALTLLRGKPISRGCPNEIGPGVYDIHSPRVLDTREMVQLLEKTERVIPVERLWVNPDCGLKTRAWPETEAALAKMVEAARIHNGYPTRSDR